MLLRVGSASADDSRCFEFASPTSERVFQTNGVQRLLIVLRFPDVDGQLAAKGLSRAARRHGIEATMMRSPEGASAHDLSVKESKANQAQMVAIVEISTGPEPKTATVEFRDDAGQEVAVLQSLLRSDEGCRAAEVEHAQPRRGGSTQTMAREKTAETKDSGFGRHRFAGDVGLASAVGLLGGTYTYSPVPAIQFELGAGVGFTGIQLSLMPKLLAGRNGYYFVFGVGPSVGINPSEQDQHTYISYWLNAEMGYEYRSPSGFSFLLAGGVTYGLGGEFRDFCLLPCDSDPRERGSSSPATGKVSPQGRLAIGHWF